jgi:hypothetical protein
VSARWVCKLCPAHGLGGPDGWRKHSDFTHSDGNRYGASMSFGFAPNYSASLRASSRGSWQRPVRAEEQS